MRADLHLNPLGKPRQVTIRLSRRNLEALLHMLDNDVHEMPALNARSNHVEILVLPEENGAHYAEQPAGVMSWER